MTPPRCTCLPLNSALMAALLNVERGSVHEQGCVENAAAEERAQALADVRAAVAGLPGYDLTIDGEYATPDPGEFRVIRLDKSLITLTISTTGGGGSVDRAAIRDVLDRLEARP